MKQQNTIIWRRLDMPGHEFASAHLEVSGWVLSGTSILVYNHEFCRLNYQINCNLHWETESAKVSGVMGEKAIDIEISVDENKTWTLNGNKIDETAGCIDVDLNFSPVTNLLPIRRLNPAINEKSTVNAAWLRFPDFTLETLEQIYTRTGEKLYHYESSGGQFVTDIEVNDFGFAINYENQWKIENGN